MIFMVNNRFDILVKICGNNRVNLKSIRSSSQILLGIRNLEDLISLNQEVLMGREQVSVDREAIRKLIRGKSILFNKYTPLLLNLISKKVPVKYKKIIWIDADVFYKDELWIDKTSESLNRYKIVQPFSKCIYLDKFGNVLINNRIGLVYGYKNIPKDFRVWNYNSGFAWAAKREFFENFGLFV